LNWVLIDGSFVLFLLFLTEQVLERKPEKAIPSILGYH
jgi:hypothetical protein